MKNLDKIIEPGKAIFYRLTNADGKTWILPQKNLSIALELYQPGAAKGRLLKRLLPYLHSVPFIRKAIHAETYKLALSKEIYRKAEDAFNTSGLEYSIFGGTPSVHQKITIQFFKSHNIVGYAKVTNSEDIAKLFSHEKQLLNQLHMAKIADIPECLYCGKLSSGLNIFIQSTTKTTKSYSTEYWTPLHEQFLNSLYKKTTHTYKFEQTDFAQSLFDLRDNISFLPDEFRSSVHQLLDSTLMNLSGTNVEYSAFHADFTPWNMFIQNGRLFVFDWEYGMMSYPPMLDRYHFYIQQALHVHHTNASETLHQLKKNDWFSSQHLKYYLFDIISRFTLREKGQISHGLYMSLKFWIELLNEDNLLSSVQ